MDDETTIDLKKYIATLFRQWQLIIGITILIIAGVGLYTIVTNPSEYESSVIIATTKTLASVDFGSAIKSFTPEQAALTNAGLTTLVYDRKARQQSYVEMVKDPAIAQIVLDGIGNKLPQQDRNVASLLDTVTGNLIQNSDSISITVKYKNPELAAEIANRWGTAYTNKINTIYNSSSNATDAIIKETSTAQEDYHKAQDDFVNFTQNSKLDEMKRRIEELQTVLKEYYGIRANMQVAAAKQDQDPRQAILTEQTKNYTEQLGQAYTDFRQTQLFINSTNDLMNQVKQGGPSAAASNALALTLLKTQIYAAFKGSATLQIQNLPESMGTVLSSVKSENMLTDLESLLTVLTNRESELQKTIDTLTQNIQTSDKLPFSSDQASLDNRYHNLASNSSTTMPNELSPLNRVIADLELEQRDLQSQVASDTGKLQELTRTRDLAWDSYSNLVSKQAELALQKTSGLEVTVGSTAGVPDQPVSRNLSSKLEIALLVGLIVGILCAFGVEIWQDYKGNKPVPVLRVFPKN